MGKGWNSLSGLGVRYCLKWKSWGISGSSSHEHLEHSLLWWRKSWAKRKTLYLPDSLCSFSLLLSQIMGCDQKNEFADRSGWVSFAGWLYSAWEDRVRCSAVWRDSEYLLLMSIKRSKLRWFRYLSRTHHFAGEVFWAYPTRIRLCGRLCGLGVHLEDLEEVSEEKEIWACCCPMTQSR